MGCVVFRSFPLVESLNSLDGEKRESSKSEEDALPSEEMLWSKRLSKSNSKPNVEPSSSTAEDFAPGGFFLSFESVIVSQCTTSSDQRSRSMKCFSLSM